MAKLSRRQFLKTLGLAGSATLAGCSGPVRYLIPYVTPPEDIVPGEATWYASTCRECPAGCGMLVKNRDGHVIKVEGNPQHPVNTGRLCPRGQASVQGLYNPDRYRQPMARDGRGRLVPVSWDEALNRAVSGLRGAGQGRSVFISHLMTGTEQNFARRWAEALGGRYLIYEPFAYEPLRQANQVVFGFAQIPNYRIDQADFLISFGADFLETWLSNVQFACQFAVFREPKEDRKNLFVHVGPRLSMTAANADHWISVPVGGERYVACGLLSMLLRQGKINLKGAAIPEGVSAFTPEVVEARTGVKASVLAALAGQFAMARRPLVLAEGMAISDPLALETAIAANLLCAASAGKNDLLDFSNVISIGQAAPASELSALKDRVAAREVGAVLLYGVNPVYNLPASWEFEKALAKVPLVISLSSLPDETTEHATLILPAATFLESWGDYSPQGRVTGLLQPAMGRFFDTKPMGDILLMLGKGASGQARFPEKDFYEVLRGSWEQKRKEHGGVLSGGAFWQQCVQRGGMWGEGKGQPSIRGRASLFTFSAPEKPPSEKKPGQFDLYAYPTIQFFDGRLANRPWLQEMPDPVTMITWSGWVEIDPETAGKMNIAKGDVLAIHGNGRTIEAPAFPYAGIRPGTLAMPMGQGHAKAFSRYVASDSTGNPHDLFSGDLDPSGGLVQSLSPVSIEKTGRSVIVANVDGSAFQHGRRLARSLSYKEYRKTLGSKPDLAMPLPSGWNREVDFYPIHMHVAYRWGMVIDLDRCIGCQACVMACYAENNVISVGQKDVSMGREMSWIHIERYFEAEQPFARFLPMLCQHCDSAPCESVCPVFAPNHNKEGINNQVYNRCIGTRDCNQNCPWKVRRFNWHQWKRDYPLEWQLNPDVTVREQGVMEKCSFCIQRIIYAKTKATSEGRKVRDGEFTTACAQTCPADAIIFGNLMDPESRVSKLCAEARAYQVLGGLNTKTAVIYLEKITQGIEV
ncbi:MAG: molybdopterin-dependent oxidoreductase [Syntrophorhabdales bacterium]